MRFATWPVLALSFACASAPIPRAPAEQPPRPPLTAPLSRKERDESEARIREFSGVSAHHRRAAPLTLYMPNEQIQNWARLLSWVDRLPEGEARENRALLERELERDVRAYQQTPELLIAAVLQRLAKMDVRRRPSADDALSWPVQPVAITSLYGHRFHPVLKRRLPHQGLDLAAEEGQPVMAASSGRVVRAGWMGAFGQCVEIEHARGMRTRYAHLSQVWVKPNVRVPQGHPIGLAGSTGQSTGAHLHFEVWKGKQPKNPLAELPPPATAPAPTGSLALQRSEGARPVRTP